MKKTIAAGSALGVLCVSAEGHMRVKTTAGDTGSDAMADLLAGTRPDYASRTELGQKRDRLVERWAADPWAFLTGVDETGRPLIWTKDEADEANPYKPFPDKAYLRAMALELLGDRTVVLLSKSRQMMVSTVCCLLLYWMILFKEGRRCLVSKQKEELAIELIRDKIRGPHSRTPKWLRSRFPLSTTPANRIDAPHTDSYILAVAQNAASGALRGGTASIALIDEAAFQSEFEAMLGAAGPMAARVWAVTTANSGNPGAEHFKALLEEGRVVGA